LTVLYPDLDPYSQYGSGSRGAISIRINVDPDPDQKHWKPEKMIKDVMFFSNSSQTYEGTVILLIIKTLVESSGNSG